MGLKARGGIIKREFFPIASGLPTFLTKGQLLHTQIEKRLIEIGLLNVDKYTEGEFIVLRNKNSFTNRRRAALAVESMILPSIKTWLTRLGFSSFNTTKTREDTLPTFCQFNWDIVGPSYISGLTEVRNNKIVPGFIVGDIILDKEICVTDLVPFFYKCDLIRNQKTHKRFIAMFIADSFKIDALNELRKRGFLVATIENLFGLEVSKSIKSLVGIIENAAAAIINNPEAVFSLLERIKKIEGASLNLRSVVIEFIVARVFSINGYQIDIRQRIRTERGEYAEIDIKAVKPNEVICIECKGKAPGNLVDKNEIED